MKTKAAAALIAIAGAMFLGGVPSRADTPSSCAALVAAVDPLYRGLAWGAPPLWMLVFPEFNMSVDVSANTADQARTAALTALAGVPDANVSGARCQGAPAVSPRPLPVDVTGYTDQAAALAATVNVTDFGPETFGRTGSFPEIWLVALPSLSTSVKVLATSEG